MRVLVVGANGLTGRTIVELLREGPHEPVAMVRKESQVAHFSHMGVETVVADLEDPLDDALQSSGAEALLFAAGSGSGTGHEKTLSVDRDGAIRSIAAMEATGAARFVMLSTRGADPQSQGSEMSPYLRAKGLADEHLRRSRLEYTILRPGRLTRDPGTGKVDLAPAPDADGSIARHDVAAVMVASLDEPATHRITLDLLSGPTPIAEALSAL